MNTKNRIVFIVLKLSITQPLLSAGVRFKLLPTLFYLVIVVVVVVVVVVDV